jgi:hypothetical protein
MNRIYVSLGHLPGADPGAVARDENGKQIMEIERIATAASYIMSKRNTLFKDVELIQVPWLTLNGRIQWINNHLASYPMAGGSLALATEIHYNSGSVTRAQSDKHAVQLWYGSDRGKMLAERSYASIVDALPSQGKSGGIFHHTQNRLGKLGFIAYTNPIAILLELGFVAWEGTNLNAKVDTVYGNLIKELNQLSNGHV